jgi:replicative DNA helicase
MEAETIGCVLMSPSVAGDVFRNVTPGHFAAEHWRECWIDIARLVAGGDEPNLSALMRALHERHKIDIVGAPRLIATVDGMPRQTPGYMTGLVRKLSDMKAARELRKALTQAVAHLEAEPSSISNGLIPEHLAAIDQIRVPTRGPHGLATIDDALADIVEHLDEPETARLSLGIPALDRATNGLQAGEYWADLGRTDSLKTMAYLNRIRGFVERYPDAAFLIANLEMPKRQTLWRVLRMDAGLSDRALEQRIKSGTFDLDGFRARYTGLSFLDRGTASLDEIGTAAKAITARGERPLRAVVIDHAGLIKAERGGSAYERATSVAVGLKQLARHLDTVVFCVVQANRAGKPQDTPEPVALEAARDSGAFEENADFCLTYSGIVEPPRGNAYIKVRLAKNRRGPKVPLSIGFDPVTLRMLECTEEQLSAA